MQGRTIDWQRNDPFGSILHALNLQGAFYCQSELTGPWGLSMPPMPGCIWFHAVLQGGFTLEVPGFDALTVNAGDFVLVPHGRGHALRSEDGVDAPIVTELPHEVEFDRYARLRYGGGGAQTTLVCGIVRLDAPTARALGEQLPSQIHLRALAGPRAQWIQSTLALMAIEAQQVGTGGETILTRLADVLVVQAIRTWLLETGDDHHGWLRALRDPRLGPALTAMHTDPQHPWTVESLAEQAAMSRSGFAACFGEIVGESPMRYLLRIRVQHAQTLLERSQLSLAEVAQEVGYGSEAAFSRAFKRITGTSPGAARKQADSRLEVHAR